MLIGDFVLERFDRGVVDDALGIERLFLLQFGLRLQQVVLRVGNLLRRVEPVALDGQALAADVAELAGDVCRFGGDVQLKIGIGEHGERLALFHHRAVHRNHVADLSPGNRRDEGGVERHDFGAQRHIILERRADDLAGLDRVVIHRQRIGRWHHPP